MDLIMELNFSSKAIAKLGLSEEEYLMLLLYNNIKEPDTVTKVLINKGLISKRRGEGEEGYFLSDKANEIISDIFANSKELKRDLIPLCEKIKEIYPKGKKETGAKAFYWTEGIKLIEKRLKIFFRKYGDHYTDEEIIDATQRYVESFKGNYTYMSLLKYFIFKEKVGNGGDVESASDLLTYIENKDLEDNHDENWTSRIC